MSSFFLAFLFLLHFFYCDRPSVLSSVHVDMISQPVSDVRRSTQLLDSLIHAHHPSL